MAGQQRRQHDAAHYYRMLNRLLTIAHSKPLSWPQALITAACLYSYLVDQWARA